MSLSVAKKFIEVDEEQELGVLHTTNTGKMIQQLSIAVAAAEFGSRPPIIAALSGLSLAKAREIYRDTTGADPIKGQLPSDTTFYINDVHCHLESAWLAQSYRLMHRKNDSHAQQCECLFKTYDLYRHAFSKPAISFDRFFLLVRYTFFGNEITLSNCPKCHGVKLTVKSWDPNKVIKCPLCHIGM